MKVSQDLSVSEIERQMKILWKKTFGDSDDYINLIFDNYFDIDSVKCEIVDGKVIASMMAIPYTFYVNTLENDVVNNEASEETFSLKGLYLCGLATDPEYRKGGIMSKLIENISERAKQKNYSFLLLIPAGYGLVKYYCKRDFIESSYKFIYDFKFIKYENSDNIKVECSNKLNIAHNSDYYKFIEEHAYNNCTLFAKIDVEKLINDNNFSVLGKTYLYFNNYERREQSINILHSLTDFIAIIKENYISKGSLYVLFNDVNIGLSELENTNEVYYNSSLLHYISRGVIADKKQSGEVYIDELKASDILKITAEPAAIVFCSNSCKEDALHIQRILCDSEESEETLLYLLKSLNTTKTHIRLVSPTPVNCIENLFNSYFKVKNKALPESDSDEGNSKVDCLKINTITADTDLSVASNRSGSQDAGMTRFSTFGRPAKCLSDMGITSITRSIKPTSMVRVLNPAEIQKILDSCIDRHEFCNFSTRGTLANGDMEQSKTGTDVIERKFSSLINASLLLE